MWIRPEVHPCQKLHKDIPEYEIDSDYIDLLNMVQRHTRCCCSTSYCLRKGWCAKCDIQLVIDHYACVEYLTKYAAKGKPRSALFMVKRWSLQWGNWNSD